MLMFSHKPQSNQEQGKRMKQKLTSTMDTGLFGNRRSFLTSAGLLALTAPAAMARPSRRSMPEPAEWWHRRNGFVLLAEGVVPLSFVLPPPDLTGIPSGLEARLRLTFPVGMTKYLLTFQVFLVPEGLPFLPLPVAPPLVPSSPDDPVTISYGEVHVEDVLLGTSPVAGTSDKLPSFAISGMVISNSIKSPFGDLTGAPCTVSASYKTTTPATGAADFVMLGVMAAGSHTTIAPTGKGSLVIRI